MKHLILLLYLILFYTLVGFLAAHIISGLSSKYTLIISSQNIKIQKQKMLEKMFCSKKSFLFNYCKSCTEKIHSEVQIEATTSVKYTVYYISSFTLFPDPWLWPTSLLMKNYDKIKCLAACFLHFGFNCSSCLDV